jgi:hypothetical protein
MIAAVMTIRASVLAQASRIDSASFLWQVAVGQRVDKRDVRAEVFDLEPDYSTLTLFLACGLSDASQRHTPCHVGNISDGSMVP